MSQSGTDSILSVYSDARTEYTKQLCVFLVPAYFQFYTDLLEKAKQTMAATEPKKSLWQFQNYLNEIHDWNMERINHEIHIIHQNSGCDYLEELLTAVFIAHTKVLTAIRLNASSKKVEINIPKVDHFLFKVLCETARLLWSSTYLFRDGIPAIEKQQNYRTIEGLLNEGILQAVRSLVPVKSILRDFVTADTSSTSREDSDEEETDTKTEVATQEDVVTPVATPQVASLVQAESNVQATPMELNTPQVAPLTSQTSPLTSQMASLVPQVASLVQTIQDIPPVTEQKEESVPISQTASLMPQTASSDPLIVLDDKPTVRFGQFNTVFGMDNPDDSDMIYEGKDPFSDRPLPDLEILDESGGSLADGVDFVNLDDLAPSEPMGISSADYEEL